MSRLRSRIRPAIHRAVILVTGLVLSTALLSVPAAAHPRHSGGKHHRGHGVRVEHRHSKGHGQYGAPGYARGHAPRHRHRFAIPGTIRRADLRFYRPYYEGRAYYAPHHHHHAIYHFPVYRGRLTRYEPFVYCEGALFERVGGYVGYDGPRVSLRVRF